jgi:transcriptional regulator with XRE-family HTH domain
MDRKGVGSLRTAENDILIRVVKDARMAAGVSQEELSRRLGQSITFIVKFERGTRRLDLIEFVRLANALNLDPEGLSSEVMRAIRSGGE